MSTFPTPEQQETIAQARRRGAIAALRATQARATDRAREHIADVCRVVDSTDPVSPDVLHGLAVALGTAAHARDCANLVEQYPRALPSDLVETQGDRYLEQHGGSADLATAARLAVAAVDTAAQRGWDDPEALDDDEAALLAADDERHAAAEDAAAEAVVAGYGLWGDR